MLSLDSSSKHRKHCLNIFDASYKDDIVVVLKSIKADKMSFCCAECWCDDKLHSVQKRHPVRPR